MFWVKQPSDRPIEVTWRPLEGDDVLRSRLLVTVAPIAKDDIQTFRRRAQTEILDDLAQWCRRALTAPEGWRLMRHDRRWTVRGNSVKAAERSGVDAQPWQW